MLDELLQNVLIIVEKCNTENAIVYASYENKLDILCFSYASISLFNVNEIKNSVEYKVCKKVFDFYGFGNIEIDEASLSIKSFFGELNQ